MKFYRAFKNDDPFEKEHIMIGDDDGNLSSILSKYYTVIGEEKIKYKEPPKKETKKNLENPFIEDHLWFQPRTYQAYFEQSNGLNGTEKENEEKTVDIKEKLDYKSFRGYSELAESMRKYFDRHIGTTEVKKEEENENEMKSKKKVSRRDIFKSSIQDKLENNSTQGSHDGERAIKVPGTKKNRTSGKYAIIDGYEQSAEFFGAIAKMKEKQEEKGITYDVEPGGLLDTLRKNEIRYLNRTDFDNPSFPINIGSDPPFYDLDNDLEEELHEPL